MDLNKLFSLKKPCKDCPFLKDGSMNRSLYPGRMDEIIEGLKNDQPFFCHKTIDYSKKSNEEKVEEAVYCAGSLVYMEKKKDNNVPMRLGRMFNLYDPSKLQGHHEVID